MKEEPDHVSHAITVKLGYYVPSREMKKRYALTKVRSIQNAIFLTGRTGSTCSHDNLPRKMLQVRPECRSLLAFQGIVNLKTCRKIEIETERLDDMLMIRKKEPKKGQKSAPPGKIGT